MSKSLADPYTELPSAIDAEEALIGSVLVDPAIWPEVKHIDPSEFYQHGNGWLWASFSRMASAGTAIDTLTIAAQMNGQLGELGGPAYLTKLITRTPTPYNAAAYAGMVREAAVRRNVIAGAGELAKLAFDHNQPIDGVRRVLAEIGGGLDNGSGEFESVQSAASRTWDNVSDPEGYAAKLLSTGLSAVDRAIGGLNEQTLNVIMGRPGMGKCLAKDTKVIMSDGEPKSVQDVRAGDRLLGPDGRARLVLSICHGMDQMYIIKQNHGMTYRVNSAHVLSLRRSRNENGWGRGEILNIPVEDFLKKSKKFQSSFKGYKVGVEMPERPLTIEPYFLGLWLGDGNTSSVSICNTDKEVVTYLTEYAGRIGHILSVVKVANRAPMYGIVWPARLGRSPEGKKVLQRKLRDLGVLGDKHIPDDYLYNSKENRLQLLAGLIDSDGHYLKSQNGPYEITFKNRRMAFSLKFLVDSLGYRSSIREKTVELNGGHFQVWRVRFNGNVDEIPVRILRKKANPWEDRKHWQHTAIEIVLDDFDYYYGFELSGDGLFLLEDFTVTHNTAFLNQVADACTERGLTVVYFPFEMSTEQTIERMAARRARVSLLRIRQNKATPEERQRLLDWIALLGKRTTLYIDDRPKTTGDMAAKCHKLAARIGHIDLILMDHLRLALDKGDNETHRLGAISWQLKQLAKSLNTRVLVGAQLNRALEARGKDDRRPTLADLRDSGEIEENADNVLGLYRARYYDPQADAVTEFGVEKCRDGQRGAVAKMVFVEHCMSFEPVDWSER